MKEGYVSLRFESCTDHIFKKRILVFYINSNAYQEEKEKAVGKLVSCLIMSVAETHPELSLGSGCVKAAVPVGHYKEK